MNTIIIEATRKTLKAELDAIIAANTEIVQVMEIDGGTYLVIYN